MKQGLHLYVEESHLAHDLIAFANASSFNNAFFSQPLSTYAAGWRDPSPIEQELDFLMPPVQVGRRFEFRVADKKTDFYTDTDDERSVGADFKVVKSDGTLTQAKTTNRGLATLVDLDEIGDEANWEQTRVARLLKRIQRNELIRAKVLLAAAAGNTGKTWDSKADPDIDLLGMLQDAGDLIGFEPNRIYMGASAWAKRLAAYSPQNTAGSTARSMFTPDQLAAWLNIEKLMVSRARVQSDASTKAQIVGSVVIAFYAEDGLSTEDSSHAKRFWSPCADGAKYRVYRQELDAKRVKLSVEHYSKPVATSTTGLKKLTIV